MKEKSNKKENINEKKDEKKDNTFIYAVFLFGVIILVTLLVALKLIGLF